MEKVRETDGIAGTESIRFPPILMEEMEVVTGPSSPLAQPLTGSLPDLFFALIVYPGERARYDAGKVFGDSGFVNCGLRFAILLAFARIP